VRKSADIYSQRRDYFDIARARRALYEQAEGGCLVGYAGKYKNPDGKELQYVGKVYLNFAILEEWPSDDLGFIADKLAREIKFFLPWNKLSPKIVLCGAPVGGFSLSTLLGQKLGCRTIKAEKKVLAVGTKGGRDETKLVLDRHEVHEGDLVIIVEDVCNNFSTTRQLIELIESYGANVIAIACFLNRSPAVDDWYVFEEGRRDLQVISLVRKKIEEFRQDDPEVASLIAAGKIKWKPKRKEEWTELMAAMHPL
jgi:adenine/guanine phosphoribosyltransferase-like PRPP-binding protein